jgi:hypothetical protein
MLTSKPADGLPTKRESLEEAEAVAVTGKMISWNEFG